MISNVLSLGEKIIDKFVPDPTQKAAAKQAMRESDLKELELSMSAIVMEAKSSDPWTSRARPSFMYVFYLIILMSVPIAILGIFSPSAADQFTSRLSAFWQSIPTEMWTTFTIGYLGYTGARSYDKSKLTK